MSARLQTISDCEIQLAGASDILSKLAGLFRAIDSLGDLADVRAVAQVGRAIADDWANMLDVEAEALRVEVGEVRS